MVYLDFQYTVILKPPEKVRFAWFIRDPHTLSYDFG